MNVLGWVAALTLTLSLAAAPAHAGAVGFEQVAIANGADAPLVVGIWYPSEAPASEQPLGTFVQKVALHGPIGGAARHPLIVMSHGTGGWFGEHYDTALALAEAGFVVAAVSHTGDTYNDVSRRLRMADRTAQLHRLIDYMTVEWTEAQHIDAAKIGAFGFSSGGFTGLVAIGGVPDMAKIAPHCQAHPAYFDCGLTKGVPAAEIAANLSGWTPDPRIKAAVIAAPALGFTFASDGLKAIHIPVQLWRAENDHVLPHPDYAEAVRLALPSPPDFHLVPGADHFDFLAPCNALTAKVAAQICNSASGFDRAAFHTAFNGEVAAFFAANLR